MIFCRASVKEWLNVSLLLNQCERASGQMSNKHKTSKFFSSNTKKEVSEQILHLSGDKKSGDPDKYL